MLMLNRFGLGRVMKWAKKFHSQINDTLVAEIISESDGSQFVCPIVMAKKSSVEWRFCIDMRRLNAMIPYITNCLWLLTSQSKNNKFYEFSAGVSSN